MRAAILALLLVACHREVRSEEHVEVDAHQETVLDTENQVVETKEQAESRITVTTTTEVYQPIAEMLPQNPAGTSTPLVSTNAEGARVPTHASALIRRTTTVRTEDRGPVTTEKKSNSAAAEVEKAVEVTHIEAKKDVETTAGPGWKLYAFIFAIVALVLGLGYTYARRFLP